MVDYNRDDWYSFSSFLECGLRMYTHVNVYIVYTVYYIRLYLLPIDLNMFSSQCLVETCSDHEMEVREQVNLLCTCTMYIHCTCTCVYIVDTSTCTCTLYIHVHVQCMCKPLQ